jgi:hypothetical protein
MTSQDAEKGVSEGFVTGHDLSRAAKANRINGALAPEGSCRSDFCQFCVNPSAAFESPTRRLFWDKPAATISFKKATVVAK